MPAGPLSLKSYVHTFSFPAQGLQTPNDSKLFSPVPYITITLWNFLGCSVRLCGANEVLFILHTDFLFCFAYGFSSFHLVRFIIHLADLSMKAIFLSLFEL